MCVTSAPAELSGTSISLARFPEYDVLGYSNIVVNQASGPNMMILHVPSLAPLNQDSFISHDCPNIHKDMFSAIQPRTRGMSFEVGASGKALVFSHDIYTVVAPQSMSSVADILAALELVPVEKRPEPNRILFEFYASLMSNFAIAFCCFNNKQAQEAKPLLIKYVPHSRQIMSVPGLDCHTGGIPSTGLVDVDHNVFFFHYQMRGGNSVFYTDPKHEMIRQYLPTEVKGQSYKTRMINGDFVLETSKVVDDPYPFDYLKRFAPGSYPV